MINMKHKNLDITEKGKEYIHATPHFGIIRSQKKVLLFHEN